MGQLPYSSELWWTAFRRQCSLVSQDFMYILSLLLINICVHRSLMYGTMLTLYRYMLHLLFFYPCNVYYGIFESVHFEVTRVSHSSHNHQYECLEWVASIFPMFSHLVPCISVVSRSNIVNVHFVDLLKRKKRECNT